MSADGYRIAGRDGAWEVVVGLEVHAQVVSQAKLFSAAPTTFGAEPNSQVSLVDAAMPGMLPVINGHCVAQAVRTGLALDRVGFTVEDRDRSRGLYFVRYVDPDQDVGKEEGFFSKLKFWEGDEKPEVSEYLISLVADDATTQLVILNKEGARESSETADRILGLLHGQLK